MTDPVADTNADDKVHFEHVASGGLSCWDATHDHPRRLSDEQLRTEVLNLPEWYQPMSNSSGSCPWCENMIHWGHDKDCPRKLVLQILRTALS